MTDSDDRQNSQPAADPPSRKKRRWLRFVLILGALLIAGFWAAPSVWQRFFVSDDAPVIGVSYDQAWHAQLGITTKNYELALARAGARTIELDPYNDDPVTVLDKVDGILLAGGGDVDPELYGGDVAAAQLVDRKRDDFERSLIREAMKRDMPILGVCRGIQILNVVQGGTLRNLRDDDQLSRTHNIGLDSMEAHAVDLKTGSLIYRLLKADRLAVNSFHGQAVDRPGQGVIVTATSTDGVVEAIEVSGLSFCLATQWHPEVPPQQDAIWQAFLSAAEQQGNRQE